ncbi:rop guanine nucleotide exchange factor 11-like [Neltuma alba]|uniref:rop guanine nucleotide exchange factor 11-like n=1 Tax=Neltuma alba TaxID=207710 RepID=UPI0010A43D32|nr:rop guanine nucleotide exchange factor 11-like [Prosopis alba]
MKERFAKLLLGEDMSGKGTGVSSALALSNAFTNLAGKFSFFFHLPSHIDEINNNNKIKGSVFLCFNPNNIGCTNHNKIALKSFLAPEDAAAVFGEQKRLEPMPPERKARWRKEINWLLSVTDYIVEMVPSHQTADDGSQMEIMTTRQRIDLLMNVPALRKLDAMLIDCLDNFEGPSEFYYVSKDSEDSNENSKRKDDDKWWLPIPKVPPEGLSENARKFLQHQKDCVNQVLKAAMAINAQVLSEMEIPENYIESLPKNGRASLGDSNYRSITVEYFDPDQFLVTMDLSSEHKILDLKNRIEASIVIWKRKMNQKDGKSAWGSAVSFEKRELFEERAENILLLLKQRFPGLPQSSLDISKIQYNRDVGQAVLESYSRILESLAFTVLSRIEDVLHADYQTQNPSKNARKSALRGIPKSPSPTPIKQDSDMSAEETTVSMTLSDFMGWEGDTGDSDMKKDPQAVTDDLCKDTDGKMQKLPNIDTNKKVSYLENLGGMRSPTSRH